MTIAEWSEKIDGAATSIASRVRKTPIERSAWLSDFCGADVFLKLENFQVAGSFKIRGATHKLLSLSQDQRARGIVTASSGNHGAAVAHAAALMGVPVRVYVPEVATAAKRKKIESLGAELRVVGSDCVEAEAAARAFGQERNCEYLSPYNDASVVAGQGTVGREIIVSDEFQAGSGKASVYAALGGGGLIGGIGAYFKYASPESTVIAVSPDQSPAVHVCLETGSWQDVPCYDTLSDATAGGVEENSVTLPLCREVVDQSILVTEDEIRDAMRGFFEAHPMMIEGAAGAAIAGLLKNAARDDAARRFVVLCGANLAPEVLRTLLG
ncbi:MAG: pyridoxal-phosphate dependent enzyme [Planctomycetota bacterium]